jgi:hypothetical protein
MKTESDRGRSPRLNKEAIFRVTVRERVHAAYPPTVDLLVTLHSLQASLAETELWPSGNQEGTLEARAVRHRVLCEVLRDGCPTWTIPAEGVGREEDELALAMVSTWETDQVAAYHLALARGMQNEDDRWKTLVRIRSRLSRMRSFVETCSDLCMHYDDLNQLQKDILSGAHALGAHDRTHCQSREAILENARVSTSKDARNVRRAFEELVDLRMLKSVRGPEGGYWITAKGYIAIGVPAPTGR